MLTELRAINGKTRSPFLPNVLSSCDELERERRFHDFHFMICFIMSDAWKLRNNLCEIMLWLLMNKIMSPACFHDFLCSTSPKYQIWIIHFPVVFNEAHSFSPPNCPGRFVDVLNSQQFPDFLYYERCKNERKIQVRKTRQKIQTLVQVFHWYIHTD